MKENARQGFYNGSRMPLAVEVAPIIERAAFDDVQRTETKEKSRSLLDEKTSHETHFVLGDPSRNVLKKNAFAMVGAPGLEPGTR